MPSKRLAFVNGRRVLVDRNERTRQDSDQQYNRTRKREDPEYIAFYNSAQWKHTREQVLLRDDSLCQRCGLQADLVDHIVPSKDDWDDRLNTDNLQSLCKSCHYLKTKRENIRHRKGAQRAMRVHVVTGYPGSGKTTYVRQHSGEHDLIYDYDVIMSALTGLPSHEHAIDAHEYIASFYELMLRKLKAEKTFDNVWIIQTYPDKRLDSLLVSHELSHILIDTSRSVCIERLAKAKRDVAQLAKVMDKIDEMKLSGEFDGFRRVSGE